jgi:hypothetical protein
MHACSKRLAALCVGFSSITLTGCALTLSPLANRSAAFGDAASHVVRDSSLAYDTVERTTYNASVSFLILDFDKSGFHRDKIKPFLPPHDLAVRLAVLQGLQAYADDLADVAGDGAFTPLDQQAIALSQNLESLSANGELQKLAPHASEAEVKGLATAVDTLGKVLIERKRRKELPSIIKKMQPVLEDLCRLLELDLGNRSVNGIGGSGLRDQLWNEYDNLIDNQADYIRDNKEKLSPSEKAAEIAKLPRLVEQQQAADGALAGTQAALRDLVETHRALLMSAKAGTFRDRFKELVQDGQQINQFYGSLNSK